MKNKPNFFFLITGVSQTGVGGPPLVTFFHIIPFFSDKVPYSSHFVTAYNLIADISHYRHYWRSIKNKNF